MQASIKGPVTKDHELVVVDEEVEGQRGRDSREYGFEKTGSDTTCSGD